jgi:hypothetical protein
MTIKYYINKETLGLYVVNESTSGIYSPELIQTLVEITAQEHQSVVDNCGRRDVLFTPENVMYFQDKPLPSLDVIQKRY